MVILITLFAISLFVRKLFSVPFVVLFFYHKARKAGAKVAKGYLYLSLV